MMACGGRAEEGGQVLQSCTAPSLLLLLFRECVNARPDPLLPEPGQQPVSLERMRQILSKVSGSLAADIIADREDRL
jgi:hypothetical protein